MHEGITHSNQGARYPSKSLKDGAATVRHRPNPGTIRLVLRLPPRRKHEMHNTTNQSESVSLPDFKPPGAVSVAHHTLAHSFRDDRNPPIEERQQVSIESLSLSSSPASVSATGPAPHLSVQSPPSPIRVPSPPFRGLLHLDDPTRASYQGTNPTLSGSMLDVLSTTDRAVFEVEVGKQGNRKYNARGRGKNKPWRFVDYPRGETPIRELVYGPEEPRSVAGKRSRRYGTASGSHEDGDDEDGEDGEDDEDDGDDGRDVGTTRGIPISRLATTNEDGRWMCEWKGCSQTFARNDHLVRHVKVAHLRLRSALSCSSIESGPSFANDLHIWSVLTGYRCEPCGLAFTTAKNVEVHSRSHRNCKP
jgi:Zinc finger, C2H2 type